MCGEYRKWLNEILRTTSSFLVLFGKTCKICNIATYLVERSSDPDTLGLFYKLFWIHCGVALSVKRYWFRQRGSTVHHLYTCQYLLNHSLFPVLLTAIQMCFYVQKYQHRSVNAAQHVSIVFHGGWHHISRTLLVHKVRMVIIAVLNSCVGLRKRQRPPGVPYVSMGQTGLKLQRRLALIKLSTNARTSISTIARNLDWTAWCKNIIRYILVTL